MTTEATGQTGASAKSGLTGTMLVGEAASYPGVNEGTTERGTVSRMEAQAAFGVELSTEYAGDADLSARPFRLCQIQFVTNLL